MPTIGRLSQNPNNNDVKFFNNGAVSLQGDANNYVDAGVGCNSLAYGNTNGFHTTYIEAGNELAIYGNTGGNSLLCGTLETGNSALQIYTTIQGGPGGELDMSMMTAPGAINVGEGGTTTGARATLDMQGLDTFSGTATRLLVGVGSVRVNGTLYLAKTNFIQLTGTSPQLDVGDNTGNSGGSPGSILDLGNYNEIYTGSIALGRGKQSAAFIGFNPAFTNANPSLVPTAYIRSNDLVSAVSTWAIGDGNGAGGGSGTPAGTVDFSGGTVDALVNAMWLGKPSQASTGSPTGKGTLTFAAGTINVNNLTNGLAATPSGGGPGTATGTINVNGTGLLVVNTNLVLGISRQRQHRLHRHAEHQRRNCRGQ